jgi:hypothetical protein
MVTVFGHKNNSMLLKNSTVVARPLRRGMENVYPAASERLERF